MDEVAEKPLADWRQGDIILAPFSLPRLVLGPSGPAIRNYKAEHGVAIVSQSCDVVRRVDHCSVVQVSPLVPATDEEVEKIESLRVAGKAVIPALLGKNLVIDLDSAFTVDKTLIASFERTEGCPCDQSQARLSRALGRHRGRFAFPDEFNSEVARPIREWIRSKYKKRSPHGELATSIAEVRVSTDSWEKPSYLTFDLIRADPWPSPYPKEWADALGRLHKLINAPAGFPEAELRLTTYDDLSAAEYLDSYKLDWDGIS